MLSRKLPRYQVSKWNVLAKETSRISVVHGTSKTCVPIFLEQKVWNVGQLQGKQSKVQ